MRSLGRSGLVVPALGVGTAAWGETIMGYGKTYGREDLFVAYRACLDAGLSFFDTAEGYGKGDSERLLGEFRKADGRPIIVATKHRPGDDPGDLPRSLEGSLRRLGADRIDLYQLHYPPKGDAVEAFMDAMADAVRHGLVRAVGVCNLNAGRMRRAYERLARHGIPLASNQIYYNLVERRAEHNGVLDLCRSLRVALIPYSPMANGLLTGSFRGGRRRPSLAQRGYVRLTGMDMFREDAVKRGFLRRLFSSPKLLKPRKMEPLFAVLEETAERHGATIPQVVLNWLLATDPLVVPIPGAKNAAQAGNNGGALGFTLNGEEYRRICDVQEEIFEHRPPGSAGPGAGALREGREARGGERTDAEPASPRAGAP